MKGFLATLLLAVLAALLMAGCAGRPQFLENGIYVSAARDKVAVNSQWGPLAVGTTIREADARAIIDALDRPAAAEAPPAARAMVSPELGPVERSK